MVSHKTSEVNTLEIKVSRITFTHYGRKVGISLITGEIEVF